MNTVKPIRLFFAVLLVVVLLCCSACNFIPSFEASNSTTTGSMTETAEYSAKESTSNSGNETQDHITHSFSNEWSHNGTYHWQACSGCDAVRNKEEHDWNAGIITVAPTETTEGVKQYTCNTCGHTKTEPIATLGHTHTFSTEWTSDENYHWHASTCGHTAEVSGKAAHTWNNGVVTKEASETEAGVKTYTCVVCSAIKTEEIPMLPHVHTFSTEWTSDEDYHWHATTCGHTAEVSEKAEHSWVENVEQRVRATTETEGMAYYRCSICGKTKTEILPILPDAFIVTFYDYDSRILKTESVVPYSSAEAPVDPYREGYRFDKWDSSYSDVQSDLEIHALYVKVYAVAFLDDDGTYISVDEVDAGTLLTAPKTNPEKTKYRFDGWYLNGTKLSSNFSLIVQSDLNIEARFVRQCTVSFLDYDGTTIETKTVDSGASVAYPAHPTRTGYTFKPGAEGWDKSNQDIRDDMTITALYNIEYYTVTFLTPDNRVLKVESVAYDHYATAPTDVEELFFTWNKNIAGYDNNTAYSDPEWDDSIDLSRIRNDTNVKLVYKTKCTDTVLIMEDYSISSKDIKDGKKANAILYIYSSSETVCGLNVELNYRMVNSQGETINYVSLDDAFEDEATRLKYVNVANHDGYNSGYSVNINTNEKTVQFVWASDGNGNALNNGYNAIITISFSVQPNTPIGEYAIEILETSYYVDSSLRTRQPVIISGKIIVE